MTLTTALIENILMAMIAGMITTNIVVMVYLHRLLKIFGRIERGEFIS